MLRRSLLVEGWCPYCRMMVQIEEGGPIEDRHVIGPGELIEPTRMEYTRRDHRMIHHVSLWPHEGWERHSWVSDAQLRLTPVLSLHVMIKQRRSHGLGR